MDPTLFSRSPRSDRRRLGPVRPVPRASSEAGFSLMEISISMVLLGTVSLSMAGVIVRGSELRRSNREASIATATVQSVVEELKATSFSEVFARFNDATTDDPEGVGTAPGARRTASYGGGSAGDPGMAFDTELIFPVDAANQLTEADTVALFGDQIDLNADGVIDSASRNADYRVLPVMVRVGWSSASGARGEIKIPYVLTQQQDYRNKYVEENGESASSISVLTARMSEAIAEAGVGAKATGLAEALTMVVEAEALVGAGDREQARRKLSGALLRILLMIVQRAISVQEAESRFLSPLRELESALLG